MKKLLFVFVTLFLSTAAFAQLEVGQHMVGGRVGLGFQLQNSGITYSNYGDTLDWGTLGDEWGLAYYYTVEEHIGLGADLSAAFFDGGDVNFVGSGDDEEMNSRLFNAMLSARFTLNPQNRFRLYVPVGAGLVSSKQKMKVDSGSLHYHKSATDNSFGWFIGAGLESDIGHSGWSWGLEARLNGFSYDYDKLTDGAPSPIKSKGNRNLSYMSFQLRVSKRF